MVEVLYLVKLTNEIELIENISDNGTVAVVFIYLLSRANHNLSFLVVLINRCYLI